EVTREPAAPAPAPAAAPQVKKKGGSKTPLLIGGLAVAGGGAAFALKKKGDGGGCDTVFADRTGLLTFPNDFSVDLVRGPAIEAGGWYAELSWSGGGPGTDVELLALTASGQPISNGGLVTGGKRKVEWTGTAGTSYTVRAKLLSGGPTTYELSIGGP